VRLRCSETERREACGVRKACSRLLDAANLFEGVSKLDGPHAPRDKWPQAATARHFQDSPRVVNPEGYTVSTIDLSSFPNQIR